jgi:hypothetical protein
MLSLILEQQYRALILGTVFQNGIAIYPIVILLGNRVIFFICSVLDLISLRLKYVIVYHILKICILHIGLT